MSASGSKGDIPARQSYVGSIPRKPVAFVANGGIGSTQIGALAVQQSNVTAVAIGSAQPTSGTA